MIHPASPALVPSALGPSNQLPLQLRRATYVHVSDLTNAYNMDHARLEEELARVKLEEERKRANVSPDASATSSPSSAVPAGLPTELDTRHVQRRLQPPRTGYNLCVLVGKVKLVVDKSRVDGSRVRLAEVDVGDETGIVSLRARDDQIDLLQELSENQATVVLRNCTLELYQGRHIRLAVTKWGKMSRYPDQIASTPPPPSKINRDRNFSLIDLTLVASELVGEPYPYSQHHQSSPDSDQQSQPTMPRTPQYGVGSANSRHAKGSRRPPTYSKAGGIVPGVLYADQQGLQHAVPVYHHMPAGGMQGYSEVSPYSYRQSEALGSSQHQLMYRQQYQLHQQRQLQHLYQSHGEQQQQNMPQSPMMNPGQLGLAASFDSFGGMSDAYMPSVGTYSASGSVTGFPPPSPGMNPKAAMYDPKP